jgi:hypothetical protein
MPWPWQKTTKPANPEERAPAEWGSSAIPAPGSSSAVGYYTYTNRYVTPDIAVGLPAVGASVRLIANTLASLPLIVYKGEGPDRERAWNLPIYRLLHDQPNADQSRFDWISDIVSCIELCGNAFLQKVKDRRGQVVEMHVLDPNAVRVHRSRDTGEKQFDVQIDGKTQSGLTTSDILHIRGYSMTGSLIGISTISQHKHALGLALAAEEYAGRAYANDGTPGLAITIPGSLGRQQSDEMRRLWAEGHVGLSNTRKPAILTNGATLSKVTMTPADVEVIEAMKYGVEQVARIFNIPPTMLGIQGPASSQTAEEESIRFARYCLFPRASRIEQALRADVDLFPANRDLMPEFLMDGLMRADTISRMHGYFFLRSAGVVTPNELRAMENLPPLDAPGANEIQMTPVGGAPNHGAGGDNLPPAGQK